MTMMITHPRKLTAHLSDAHKPTQTHTETNLHAETTQKDTNMAA